MTLNTNKINKQNFANTQYYEVEVPKKQIYLHHTAGNASAINTASGWAKDAQHISTAFIVAGKLKSTKEKDGDIIQCFGSKYWAYHLGLKTAHFKKMNLPYINLDKQSIAIEICNWGPLTKKADGTYLNYLKKPVPATEVCTLAAPYKGYIYFHKYTDAQIAAVKDLLVYLCDKYKISKTHHADIFDLTPRAFKAENGIFTHNSVRKDKWDIYPCSRMIAMLKTL